jgi:hypothetical protein
MRTLFLALIVSVSAISFAGDIVIPPLAECKAVDARGTAFQSGTTSNAKCNLFDSSENGGCTKIVGPASEVMKLCQAKGRGACKITECWENAQ